MLGSLGPAHPAARVALDVALEDEDAVVRRWAQWAQGHAAARSIFLSLDARRPADLEWMELPWGARRTMSASDHRAEILVPELEIDTSSHVVVTNVDGHCRIHDPKGAYGVVVSGVCAGEQPVTAPPGERVLVGQAAFYVHEEPPPPMHEDLDLWLATLAGGPRDHRWLAARVLERWVKGSEVVKAALARATEDAHAPVRAWAQRVLMCPDDALRLRVEAAVDMPFATRELTLYRHERYRIGGDSVWADITFGVPGMADRVAIVASDACGFWVEDLESHDGVSLNGSPICGPTSIEPGDRIRIRSLLLSVLEPAAPSPA